LRELSGAAVAKEHARKPEVEAEGTLERRQEG
jgi:hypothetical protein